jgi:hypothetical protein
MHAKFVWKIQTFLQHLNTFQRCIKGLSTTFIFQPKLKTSLQIAIHLEYNIIIRTAEIFIESDGQMEFLILLVDIVNQFVRFK